MTGLTARQLQWWDARRLFLPAIAPQRTEAGGFTERRYTPLDVLELQVLADLRRRGFSVPRLRRLLSTLREVFSVRLYEASFRDWRIGVVGGVVCPLTGIAIAALLSGLLDLDPTQQGLLILFGSLPPAVLNFMVAEQFRQEPGKVASIVLIGNLLSIVFVPIGLGIALRG